MKMAAIPYVLYPHSTSFPLLFLLLLHFFYDCHWPLIILEYQTKKMSNNETFLVRNLKESSTYNI